MRLTAFYGGLFLLAGVVLLTITNILVNHTTGDVVYSARPADRFQPASPDGRSARSDHLPMDARQLHAELGRLHARDVHQFLVQSGVALAITAVACIALGYVLASRALRPVRTITAQARTISAHNLHKRVKVEGPADELKLLGDTFDELLDRLEQAFDAQRQFIANVSHELRSPLARQRAITEVALGDAEANAATLRAAHERVLVAEVQQERLIDALLALARGQASVQHPRPVDLADITARVLDARRDEASRRGLKISTSLDHAETTGDPRLVERLATNLIDNAIRHNQAGGRVDIRTSTHSGSAHLDVANTGPVVPAAAVERIFQPFRRLDPDRTHSGDGLGLGLSIVQAIANSHGAAITTSVRPEGGLHIRISFTPIADTEPNRASTVTS
ncbi:sensor histidine kinase [Pseudofrankia inefficax]|uniref:histidine kinase n=1 Tax=Pseudofrankia inefficax (strain DSM 45817 / CECT 9037 / DDB 130130 / EuI1c) TaxID=298654 RepID=E3J679_PSEI1|nr:HAMP domain-containing sensor histidine kinase [Pseudofrankia inefficax]ADP79506.1 integral membrane sensor signal transduction histidine kinase [Pseudofrankia inefficax]